LVERHENEVWAGTERHGVWRFRLTAAGEIADARRFTQADGLPVAMPSEAKLSTLADGNLIASTRKGFFRLDGERFVSTDPDTLSALRLPDELLTLVPTPQGGLWGGSATRVLQRIRADTWQVHDVRLLRVGAIENTYVGADGAMAFTSTHALLLHQPTPVVSIAPAPAVALRAVTQKLGVGADVSLPLRSKEPIRLHEGGFGLQFDFSLPEVVRPGVQSYQGRLVGAQDTFSEWSSQHRYLYSSLKPGTYALEVRARDSQGRVSEIEPYRFEVLPAWHATTGARMVIAILCVAAAWALMLLAARHRTRRLEHANATLESKVAARTRELADANRRLETMVHVDGLTGISNRRRLDEYLPVVWQLCREQERPLSILLLDVDHFKHYNDTHGHLAGDQLLQQIAQRLQHGLRRTEDLLARYGGEEFLVMLPGADAEVAHATGESMRAAIAESALGVTISIGTCSRVPDGVGSPQAMVADADAALYRAKRDGRNRVCACAQDA
jgi:diguanylate cyclase (GGDEF)-like protein